MYNLCMLVKQFVYTLEYTHVSFFNIYSLFKNYLVFVISVSGFMFEVNPLKAKKLTSI